MDTVKSETNDTVYHTGTHVMMYHWNNTVHYRYYYKYFKKKNTKKLTCNFLLLLTLFCFLTSNILTNCQFNWLFFVVFFFPNTGELLRETVYQNWAPNQPSSLFGLSIENCCCMRRADNWKWHDYHCHMDGFTYNFICQYRKYNNSYCCQC